MVLPPIHCACADFITLSQTEQSPVIHSGLATSPAPTLHCFPAFLLFHATQTQALESEPVTIETTQKDKVEERRERPLHTNGGREQASDVALL